MWQIQAQTKKMENSWGSDMGPYFFFMETPIESRSDTMRNMCLNI